MCEADFKDNGNNNMVDVVPDEKLRRLQSKAKEWYGLGAKKKMEYIKFALEALSKSLPLLEEVSAGYQKELRKVTGEEYEFYHAWDVLVTAILSQDILNAFYESLKVQAGESNLNDLLTKLETRVSGNGQVIAKVFPLLSSEKSGGQSNSVGEVMFQADKIKTVEDVKPFSLDLDECNNNQKTGGVCVVLGAGNYPPLTVSDVLHQLFYLNQVVFVKQHELRGGMDKILRWIFKPLYEDGYMNSEVHVSLARTSELLYSPYNSGVHITGGKAAHDAIVWGATPEERERRIRSNDLKIKGTMTSELGAVTPYIVTPAKYTGKELDHQATVIVTSKWINGGASCNAPQVVVMSKGWEQRESFVRKLKEHWTNMYSPVVYYPGSQDRVDVFSYQYADRSTTWMGKMELGAKSNHMPLLVIDIDVDLSSEQGRKAAAEEYAFQTEAFGPVLVLANIKSVEGDAPAFMEDATTLCNNYLFGSLSCSLMVPDTLQSERFIEKAVEDLKYGGITLNSWSGVSYAVSFGTWGAFPGEKLDSVESGSGHVHNCLMLPFIEKTTARKSIIDEKGNLNFTKPRRYLIALFKAAPKFILQPSLKHLLGVLSVVIGPAIYIVPTVMAAVVAVGARFVLSHR